MMCKVIEDRTHALELLFKYEVNKTLLWLASIPTAKSSKGYIKIKCLIKKFNTFISPNLPCSPANTDFRLSSLVHYPPHSLSPTPPDSFTQELSLSLGARAGLSLKVFLSSQFRVPSNSWPSCSHYYHCYHNTFYIS